MKDIINSLKLNIAVYSSVQHCKSVKHILFTFQPATAS